ncbi:ATP-binding cassette domain-containing protein, partial [Desulfovibrio sp. OttesenSCG-928-A18]|nr:ATP-binding cassette domain-containing protein [Desulfovibrio sp. OttesenSCG-928-A18]
VEDDSFLVITGPNGGGKSTLAKVIMGIQRPSSGRILLDGEDISDLDVTERAKRGIGFAFQQPVRFKGLLVRDLLSLAAGKSLNTDEACRYLSEVGMCANDYINRELNNTLSGGELKRIEIAMLMARGTKVSIFDEPEAGIDLWSFQNLIKVFKSIRKAQRGAAVIISHQERILEVADVIVVITQGRITQAGPRDEVLPALADGARICNIITEKGPCYEELRI